MAGTIPFSSEETQPDPSFNADAWEARRLLRAARVGTLATVDAGTPYAALVTPACMPDGALAVLLSDLSGHTNHLKADPRCALLVAGPATDINPQTAPRLSVNATAERSDDPALKRRYLAIHPYAALYADFGDFAIWRLAPERGQFVGGFARAARLDQAMLTPDADAVSAILAAEEGIITHCNADHMAALLVIAQRAGAEAGDWRMVTADSEGFDLAAGDRTIRIAWQAPVRTAGEIRGELVRLARR